MSIRSLFKKGANFNFAVTLFLVLLVSTEIWAQKTTTVSGTVIDASGITIPGVNIVEKGTTNSVSTDLDGKFSISVNSSKSELVFSYLGYETFSQVVGQKKTFSIVLKNSAAKLDEVVVIGYGTSKKSDLTGSVATISGDDLKKLSIANVAETLTGRLAGVQVTSSEGSPDSDIKIKIRGSGSLTQDSSPLLIVDGFPVNSISDISPSDIENITVLKDASSTAIYGSRGSNGVVIVTTKSGKDNAKIAVTYNIFHGAKTIAKTIDVLQPEDFVKWQYEYALLKNSPTSYEQYFGPWSDYNQYVGQKGTNWQKEIYGRLGEVISQDLGIRGGSDKMNFNFNYARYDEKAIMVGSNFIRNNLSFSLKNKASKKVDLTYTFRYSDTQIDGSGANEQKEVSSSDARLRHSVGYAPIPLPGLTTDDTDEAISGYLVNPFVAVADNNKRQLKKNFNMLTSFSWKIMENLQFKSDIGLDNYNYLDYRFYGRSTYYVNNVPAAENQKLPSLIFGDRKELRFRNANTLSYDYKSKSGNKIKILLGEETINYKSNEVTSVLQGFPKLFSFDDAVNLSSQGKPQSVTNFYSPDDRLLSFFGRVNCEFQKRFLVTATYRADGSSKFLGDNRWGYFPSLAVAWKLSEEDFLKDISWVNSLKVRYSSGASGNNNIPNGQTVQTFQSSASAWINNVSNYWSASNVMANPNLKWETTKTNNLGIDFDFFKGRITGSFETYINTTKDLLIRFPVPGTGYDYQYRNMGELQNTGIEASLNLVAIEKSNYGLNFSFNIGANKNRINSLGVMNNFGAATGWASTSIGNDFVVNVGDPIGLIYGYQNDGRYEVSDFNFAGGVYSLKTEVPSSSYVVGPIAPGSMKIKDTNGDGVINTSDLSVIGNTNPKHTGGFVINANAYGFDLSAAFNWSFGNDIYNANKIEFNTTPTTPNGQYRNLSTIMADGTRWTNLDPASGALVTDPTALEALNANTTMWSPNMSRYVMSDWAVEDGSFLRLNTLTLGYTIPKSIVSKLGVSRMKIYATGNNVFIITKYSGLDPEVSTRRATPLTPGVDYSPYPRSRQVVFGLNLTF